MIIIKIRKEKLNSKFYRFLGNLIFALILFLVESVLSLAIGFSIGYLFSKIKVSNSFTQFKTLGDWVIAGLILLSLVIGTMLVTQMCEYSNTFINTKSNKDMLKIFILGNVGAMMICSSILSFFGEITSFSNSKITVNAIKKVANWSNINYNVGYILIVLTLVLMLVLSRKWIERNYWYVLGTFALPTIYLRQLLISHLNWEKFINAKSTTYSLLTKMFIQAKQQGNVSINVTLMNEAVKCAIFCSLACLLSLILIGGAVVVIQEKEKIRKWLEERTI